MIFEKNVNYSKPVDIVDGAACMWPHMAAASVVGREPDSQSRMTFSAIKPDWQLSTYKKFDSF